LNKRIGNGFFFSSRRRHTRCYRDWSSDVCSSDLATFALSLAVEYVATGTIFSAGPTRGNQPPSALSIVASDLLFLSIGLWLARRSEERRVGKEWADRMRPGSEKKKYVGRCQEATF